MRFGEGMQITVCARRSLCQCTFGQGFNSPHLHQNGRGYDTPAVLLVLLGNKYDEFRRVQHDMALFDNFYVQRRLKMPGGTLTANRGSDNLYKWIIL